MKRIVNRLRLLLPWLPDQRQKRWNVLLLIVVATSMILLGRFLGYESTDIVQSRELLRLTSTPHIVNEASGVASRGKPLQGLEVKRDAELLEKAPYKVYAGIYVTNNFDVNLEIPAFSSKGYLWMQWDQAFQDYLSELELSIEEVISFENDINPETTAITPLRESRELGKGLFSQGFVYTGQFYIDALDLRHFPFNSVSLPVVLEAEDPFGDLVFENLRLIPDLRDSGLGLYSSLPGWLSRGWSIGEYRHHFSSGLGFSAEDNEFSQLIFDSSYQRSSWSAFWTLIQPLIIVMASVVLITRVLTEFRIEIPVAVLLTLIFLQEGYKSNLPDLSYLTFMDSVYVVAYLTSFMSFGLVLYLEAIKRRASSVQDPDLRRLLLRRELFLEQIWPSLSLSILVGVSLITWLLT